LNKGVAMVLDIIKNRHSLRSYDSQKEVSQKNIEIILEAGRLAPSWVNVQPWHFIVVKNLETKKLLCELSNNQSHVEKASVIIVCCCDLSAWERKNYKAVLESRPGLSEERINQLLNNPVLNPTLKGENEVLCRTLEQMSYAVGFMSLQAESLGIGTCIVGAVGNFITGACPEIAQNVKEKLNLPDSMFVNSLLLLGYPTDGFKKFPKVRKNKEDVISYEIF
ncbi:MAG: nitroreductase family protein, partial [Candidatus Gastranaerophilales bacterium]|nr:nitroreductase family protein [Candidatus Gastranaerophilales bacterium]